MDNNYVYFVTGANRGIGLHLTRTLLLRENTTVVATRRSSATSSPNLEGLQRARGSMLIIIPLAYSRDEGGDGIQAKGDTVYDLVERLRGVGVERIDTLILNAGAATSFESVRETRTSELLEMFEVNTVWPVQIWQVVRPLLVGLSTEIGEKSGPAEARKGNNIPQITKKIIYISSALGSITGIDDATPSLAYGISKAGANYFVRKVHFEEGNEGTGVVCLALHPGWVKTSNGQAFADCVGVEEPPMELEECVNGALSQIDNATRETTSGCFVSYHGKILPW